MRKLILIIIICFAVSCGSGACKDYESLQAGSLIHHFYVKNLSEEDAICIAKYLQKGMVTDEQFFFYNNKTDFVPGEPDAPDNWKYHITFSNNGWKEVDLSTLRIEKKDLK